MAAAGFALLPPLGNMPKVEYTRAIDRQQIRDIQTMIREQPIIHTSLSNFEDNVLIKPFDIVFGNMASKQMEPMKLRNEIADIISKYWMPWVKQMNYQTMLYGFSPFYFHSETVEVLQEEDNDDDDDMLSGGGGGGDPVTSMMLGTLAASTQQQPSKIMGTLETLAKKTAGGRLRGATEQKSLVKKMMLYWPVCPSFEMGAPETFVYEKDQYLVWKWSDKMGQQLGGKIDMKMYFIVETMPSLETGKCNSRLATLLPHWKNLDFLKRQNNVALLRMNNPQSVIEYTPNMGATSMNPGVRSQIEGADTRMSTWNPGTVIPSTELSDMAERNITGIQARLSAATEFGDSIAGGDANLNATYVNAGLDPIGMFMDRGRATTAVDPALDELDLLLGRFPHLEAELGGSVRGRLRNADYLKAYQHYVPVANTSMPLIDQILQMQNAFNDMVSNVLNSPSHAASGIDKRSQALSYRAQREAMHRRVNFRIKFFCSAIKRVFKLAFIELFEQLENDIHHFVQMQSDQYMSTDLVMFLEHKLDFQVVFNPSTEDLEDEEIVRLYELAAIDEHQAFNFLHQRISFTDPPVEAPPAFVKRMQQLYRQEEAADAIERRPEPIAYRRRSSSISLLEKKQLITIVIVAVVVIEATKNAFGKRARKRRRVARNNHHHHL